MNSYGQGSARQRIEAEVERHGVAVVEVAEKYVLVGRAALGAAGAAVANPVIAGEYDDEEEAWWVGLLGAAEPANSLTELRGAIEAVGRIPPDCPTYGGEPPSCTDGVWSWDETTLLVGTCAEDLEWFYRDEEDDEY